MEISFLGQGLGGSDKSVGSILINSFSDAEFNKFSSLVAFASLSGIDGISSAVKNSKQHIKQFGVVVGIDQKGTSKEALEALLGLDIGTRIYYTISHIIFHPKIYLFEGDKKCRIILGSSNLTQTGLCQNIEASFVIDFSKPDEKGEKLLKQIYDYFKSFFDGDIGNLNKLTQELIEKLFEGGIIPDESERIKVQEDKIAQQKETGKAERWGELKTLFPKIELQKLPNGFIKKEKVTAPPVAKPITITPAQEAEVVTPAQDDWELKGKLVWKKKKLPATDVLFVKTKGTNPTGSLRFSQADWMISGEKIDQTKYFRYVVFGKLAWAKTQSNVEMAKVLFNVKILGKDNGQHRLILRHNPDWESGQGNITTSLSWGELSEEIRKKDLKGKDFYLYAPPEGQNEPFYIEIKEPTSSTAPLDEFF